MSQKIRKPAISWSAFHEAMLFELWEENLTALKSAQKKHTYIYKSMCEKFLAAGFNVEWKDVKTKLDNLIKKYKNEIKKRGPSQWHHFAKVHRILSAEKPINLEEYVLDSMDPDEGKWDRFMTSISELSDSSDSYSEDSTVFPESSESESFEPCGSAGPPAKKRRRGRQMTEFERLMVKDANRRTDILERLGKARLQLMERLIKAMEKRGLNKD